MRLTIPKVVDYITNLEHFCNMDRCEITKVVFQFRAGCITIRFRIVALMPRWLRGGIHVYVARGTQIAGGGGSQ